MTFLPRAVALCTVVLSAACASSATPFIAIPTPAIPVLTAAPSTVAVNGLGVPFSKTITVTEAGYKGTFDEVDTCAALATLESTSAIGPSAAFVATGLATGRCSATFMDAQQNKTTISITVSVSSVVIDVHKGARHHA